MKRIAIMILAALAALAAGADDRTGPVPVPERIPDPVDDDEERPYLLLIGQADEAAAEGRWQDAADRLVDAMSVEPGNPSNVLLLGNLGMMYSAMDRDSLALVTFDHALNIAPAMTALHNNRARVLIKMGRDEEASQAFAHVIELDSLNTDARYYHGLFALYGGDMAGAEADFDVLASQRPKSLETAVALGTLYSLTGRDSLAIPYLQRLCTDDPAPEFFASLAGCLLATSDLAEAAATIADGLKRYPYDPELYYYRAWLNRERMRLDDARDDARRAIDLGAQPDRVAALFEKPTPSPKR